MARKVGGPVRFLADSAFRSEAVAYAALMQSAASRARLAEELASGVAGDTRPIGDMNPQGTVGIDLSGPPWGSALMHPVATSGGMAPTSGMTGDRPAVEIISTVRSQIGPFVFWNRPHAALPYPSVAPYSRLFFAFHAYVASGTSTLTVALRVHSMVNGSVIDELLQNYNLTTTETAYQSSTSYFQGCTSGHMAVSIGVWHDASPNAVITSWSIYQKVKRSH